MKILIIGGTGFLGYHASLKLIEHGHTVTIVALPPMPAEGLFPPDIKIHLADINQMSDENVQALLSGQDALIFAAGVDDRATPKKPAYPFFYKHNVESVQRLFSLARQSGVKRGVVLGSYFVAFHRFWPELRLTEHHPYIRSREEQERIAIEAGGDSMAVMIVELPYIFGSMPGRTPMWKPLVDYLRSGFPIFYPRGGTTCVTVQQVAEAIRGAVEHGEAGVRYPIGGENLTWVDLLRRLGKYAGLTKKVITLPDWVVRVGTFLLKSAHAIRGLESGLDPIEFVKIQTANTFLDIKQAQKVLGYSNGDIDKALEETVIACTAK